ncbi:MAG: hypothetical protein GWP68_07365, partial [Verrucomicrobiaceae bacterium]|nr:hypothetical protein [Verrucomicrobiaceae bacterium]
MIFLGKMMHAIMVRKQTARARKAAHAKLLPLAVAMVITPLLLSDNAAAQDVDIHPSDLFETPQEGIGTPLPRSSRDAESWKDYFHLTLNAGVRGESNVFLNDDNEGEESDIIFTIGPTLTFTTPGLFGEDNVISDYMTPRVSVSYTPRYQMYSNNSEYDGINHSFRFNFNNDAGLDIRLPKTTISFDLDYDQSQGSSRFSEGIVESESLSGGIRVAHALSGKTSLNFGARARSTSYDSSDLIDDVSYNFNASLQHKLTGKISVGPYVGYGISNLSGAGQGVENTQDRYSYSAGITGSYNATGKTAFTGSVGWSTYEFDGSDAGSGNDGINLRMGVSHQLGPRTSLRASIWRNYKASNTIGNTSYWATGASISLSRRQSGSWSHNLTLTYENDDYFS